MAKVDQEHASSGITLTPTQAEMAQSVIEVLKMPGNPRTLVIVNGLSGIGKSTVLDELTSVLPQYNAIVVESGDIKYLKPQVKNSQKHLVTTTTIGDFEATAEWVGETAVKTIPGISVHTLDLPGMNKKEMLAYITRLKHANALSSEQIAQYSMGIPLLAEKIASQGVDGHIASYIAAKYLKESFRRIVDGGQLVSAVSPYLQMPIPANIQDRFIEIARAYKPTFIYENLLRVLEKQKKLEQRGIIEDSPLFLAPESEAIYDKILKKGEESYPSWIDIFAPEISAATLAKFQQAFGSKGGAYFWDYAARVDMFLATERKVSIWSKDEHGQEGVYEGEYDKIHYMGHALTEAFQNGELPVTPHGQKDAASFYVHAHDHAGMITNPAQIGWLTESLLQQNGVPYVVLSRTLGTNYAYDPAKRHIVMAPSKIDLDKYVDRYRYGR